MYQASKTLSLKYSAVRAQTELIVKPLEIEDFVTQPIVDVSPPKWHLGHTTWFFENFILIPFSKNYSLYNAEFNYIFNSYYESQGDRILRDKRGALSRPTTEEVFNYRNHVDTALIQFLEKEDSPSDELLKFLEIGLNHEQQHQELLITDIKYILGANPLLPPYKKTSRGASANEVIKLDWLRVAAGNYTIGYQGNNFHFDNEKGVHQIYLEAFECTNRLITNGEYLDFMKAGGYEKSELWLAEGWDWVKTNQAKAPFYWFRKNKDWFIYQLDGVQAIDLSETVTHINFYEAEAFARWKGKRLLSEQEWEVAASIYGNTAHAHFQEQEHFHPGKAKDEQFFGTAWEWTNSAYLPYPFYRQEAGALGEYNGKFMINQMVLRGGSCATPKDHFRISYRNFFHPHLQWQFTGIRLGNHLEPLTT